MSCRILIVTLCKTVVLARCVLLGAVCRGMIGKCCLQCETFPLHHSKSLDLFICLQNSHMNRTRVTVVFCCCLIVRHVVVQLFTSLSFVYAGGSRTAVVKFV